jgi:hypothetical protein
MLSFLNFFPHTMHSVFLRILIDLVSFFQFVDSLPAERRWDPVVGRDQELTQHEPGPAIPSTKGPHYLAPDGHSVPKLNLINPLRRTICHEHRGAALQALVRDDAAELM